MKRNIKNWMMKAAVALALGAGMLGFAAPKASAQPLNPHSQNEQLRQRQVTNWSSNRAVNPQQQEQQRFTYQQQPYRQYGNQQYGQYGTGLQSHRQSQSRLRHEDARYYQRNDRRW
jgi:hypothetical protein